MSKCINTDETRNRKKAAAEEVVKILRERGYSSQAKTVIKNGTPLMGISVSNEESNEQYSTAAVFYLEGFAEEVESLPPAKVMADEIIKVFTASETPEIVKTFTEDVKNKRPIKTKDLYVSLRGDRFLENTDEGDFVYKKVCDGLYAVVRQLFSEDQNGNRLSRTITPYDLAVAGLTEEEVYEAAEANTLKLFNFRVANFITMKIVTNSSCIDGAAGILFPEIQEQVKEELGTEKFYILPSSIHEVIVISDTYCNLGDTETLKKLISEVNSEALKPEDFLSDNLFFYDGEKIINLG